MIPVIPGQIKPQACWARCLKWAPCLTSEVLRQFAEENDLYSYFVSARTGDQVVSVVGIDGFSISIGILWLKDKIDNWNYTWQVLIEWIQSHNQWLAQASKRNVDVRREQVI